MTPPSTTTRDRILNALQRILVGEGASGVTLEKVAVEAGVSKGGLLYHFKTKADLYDGLAGRFRRLEEDRLAAARRTGVVETFIRGSQLEPEDSDAALWALFTALRGSEELSEQAKGDLMFIFNGWSEALHEAIDDPVTAEIVRLVGDGLFLSALSGLPLPSPPLLEDILERLVEDSDRR